MKRARVSQEGEKKGQIDGPKYLRQVHSTDWIEPIERLQDNCCTLEPFSTSFFSAASSSHSSSSCCFSFFQIIWSNVKSRLPTNNKYLNKSREVISLNQKEKYEQVESVHNGKNRWSTYRMCYAVRVLGSRFVCALFCSTSAKKRDSAKKTECTRIKIIDKKNRAMNPCVCARTKCIIVTQLQFYFIFSSCFFCCCFVFLCIFFPSF